MPLFFRSPEPRQCQVPSSFGNTRLDASPQKRYTQSVPSWNFQKSMIALRKRIENLERNHKWNYAAIAKDLGISIEEVKACHPAAHPQNHDWVAIAALFGIDLGKPNG